MLEQKVKWQLGGKGEREEEPSGGGTQTLPLPEKKAVP